MPDQPATDIDNRPSGVGKWFALAALIVVLDQLTKWIVLDSFREGERLNVIPGLFDLTLWFNPGAAFSFLAGAGGWQRWFFTVVGIGAAIFISYLLRQTPQLKLFSLGLSLIMGGAIGNVIDRFVHSKVVDFLLFYQGNWAFPAFNLADSAITVGAACLIGDELRRYLQMRKSDRRAADS